MPTNVKEFNRKLKNFSKTLLPEQVVLAQKKIALDLFTKIIVKTPVDTGRARGNWQITINAPATGVIDVTGGKSSGDGALTAGSKKISSVKGFVTIFITNNVDYIGFLEEGSSDQAPKGMVALSIAEVSASLFV